MAKNKITLKGTLISKKEGYRLQGLRIEAWDKDLLHDDMLGSVISIKQEKCRKLRPHQKSFVEKPKHLNSSWSFEY